MLGFDSLPACGMRGEMKGMASDVKKGIVVVGGLSFHVAIRDPKTLAPFSPSIFSSSSSTRTLIVSIFARSRRVILIRLNYIM